MPTLLSRRSFALSMYAPSRRGREGISGSGKSTVANSLCQRAREYGYTSECIGIDGFFNTENRAPLPSETLEKLAACTQPCLREKRHDTNSPAAINWSKFLSEISQRRSRSDAPEFLFVEGFLCFCKEGSPDLSSGTKVFDAAVFVSVSKDIAMERKRARSYPHVSPEEFEVYFNAVTYPNYCQYGRSRPSGLPLFPYHNDRPQPDASSMDELMRKLLPVVVCVGDLHGWLDRGTSLFANLQISLPPLQFSTADIVFLGDYVDRGPQSNETIEWLINHLPRAFPRQRHFFLAGNHELALIAALGDLTPPEAGFDSWKGVKVHGRDEKVWDGPGSADVHWQGRRYVSRGSGDIYDSNSTMASYGIDCASITRAHGYSDAPAVLRQALQDKIPRSHRDFLMACDWVIEFPARGSWLPQLTFVHAGFTADLPVETQLAQLRAKDCRDTRITQLSGRTEVLEPPREIVASGGMLISGHHGFMQVKPHRAVIDESGGCVGQLLAAMLLPYSAHACAAGSGADVSHGQQYGPVFVYSEEFRPSMFWNLDAMWEAAYARARHDASIDFVLHVGDLAREGRISREQMRQWVNRQKASSGYTLLHQVSWHDCYDRLKDVFVSMGADEDIKTLNGKTAQDIAKMHCL